MSSTTMSQSVRETVDSLIDIYSDMYDDWSRSVQRLIELVGQPASGGAFALPTVPGLPSPLRATCCGEIPPACWMPRELPEQTSQVCAGQAATVCLRIVNRSMTPRTVMVETGTFDTGVTISNSPLSLAPMEEGAVSVSYQVPQGAAHGESRAILLWIRGCEVHLLRWTVVVGRSDRGTCIDVDVEDCPDNVHHWYDHFYCAHPCVHQHG